MRCCGVQLEIDNFEEALHDMLDDQKAGGKKQKTKSKRRRSRYSDDDIDSDEDEFYNRAGECSTIAPLYRHTTTYYYIPL